MSCIRTAPGKVGDSLDKIYTPALMVDLDKLENNLQMMSEFMKRFPAVTYRAHTKAHKCPDIALLQIEHGSAGICCQTVVEAEAMVQIGITDIFISNQVAGPAKIDRFLSLAKKAKMSVCVDNAENIRNISSAACYADVTVDLVVEVNVGTSRCGILPGSPLSDLADLIVSLPNVNFKGIHAFNGQHQQIINANDRKCAVNSDIEKMMNMMQILKEKQIPCNYITGAGTGTFLLHADSNIYTEIQPGSYALLDSRFRQHLDDVKQPLFRDFEQCVYVLSTVISVTPEDRAVVDAGVKALFMGAGEPQVMDRPDLHYADFSDEHGVLRPDGGYKVGDRIWIIPRHTDRTVPLHDYVLGIRNNVVETVWPLTA